MGTLFSEVGFALRALARRPAYALLAIVTLALGIGANTAIFSAFYRLVIEPLPYPEADRLAYVMTSDPTGTMFMAPRREVTAEWLEHSRSFFEVARHTPVEMSLTGQGEAVVLEGTRASAELQGVLRMEPLAGRSFTAEEAASGAKVVVLSESVWRRRFGGAASAIGRTVRLQGEPHTIVGVMPAAYGSFNGIMGGNDFWVPLGPTADDYSLNVIGRLAEGVTPEMAGEELYRLGSTVVTTGSRQDWRYEVIPAGDLLDPVTRQALPILLGAVALVLLIACANVAGLLMVRLSSRAQELAIRAALGANRARLLATVVAEQGIVAFSAGLLGVLLAVWTMSAIRAYRPANVPLLDTIALEPLVLLFALALVIVTIVLFTAIPAVHLMRNGARAGAGTRLTQRSRARSVLVTAEIALSVVLVVGAALLLRSFVNLQGTELGFETNGRLVVDIALPEERYGDAVQRQALYTTVVEGLAAIPGVEQIAVAGAAPPVLGVIFGGIEIEGRPGVADDVSYVSGTGVSAGFIDVLGARIIDGRGLRADDAGTDNLIINRGFAERFWPDESAVGKRFTSGGGSPALIVGVFDDLALNGPIQSHSTLQMFVPLSWDWPSHSIIIETSLADPLELAPAIRQVVRRVDANLPVRDVASLAESMSRTIDRQRFVTGLLVAFAVLALALSSIGLYALVSWSLQQRLREIGVRIALGASPRAVYGLFVREGIGLTMAGVVLGLVGAIAGGRILGALLHGVTAHDGAAWAAAVLAITAPALLASLLPARRAARTDPVITLRAD